MRVNAYCAKLSLSQLLIRIFKNGPYWLILNKIGIKLRSSKHWDYVEKMFNNKGDNLQGETL